MKSFFSNKIDREELKLGDHIYSWRTAYIYAHHGIYVGDGNVIHFTGTKSGWILFSKSPRSNTAAICERCGGQSRFHGVIMSCLDCFLAGGNLYRFNYAVSPVIFFSRARGGTCTLAASDPSDDVLHRARCLLNNGFGDYSLFEKNCEDFALYCKTGVHVGSGQIKELDDAFVYSSLMARVGLMRLTGLRSPVIPVVMATSGIYGITRFVSDMSTRRVVERIPVESLVANSSGLEEPEFVAETAERS